MTEINVYWEVQVSPQQMTEFTELLQAYATHIAPGESLKEIRIIADDALAERIQLLTGKPYQAGSHYPEGVAVPIEQTGDLSCVILIRKAVFRPGQEALHVRILTLLEELYHCRLYHQTWQRRGYLHPHGEDPYASDLFITCNMLHDEYAVARLKNTFLGQFPMVRDAQGQPTPWYSEYGASLSDSLAQASHQVHDPALSRMPASMRKSAMLPIAYRFIFEPLARHAGFLTPIPPDYQLHAPDNRPEQSAFYRDVIASYWLPIKQALEASFASEFSKTEEMLETISEKMDACLEELLKG
ncbi:MAG TPA: hypothetical protein VH599_07385 [Ktedonobacterales bacterium]